MNHKDFKEKLEYISQRYANKTSMVYMTENCGDVRFSFSDIYNIIIETQSVLQKCGVVCGDRAAIITPHSPFGVMAELALAYSNITAVMIDASLPIEEICRLLEFSDVRALFTTNDLYDKISHKLTQNIPCFELGKNNTVNKFISGSVENVSMPETVDKDTDVIAIIFSSGTTGTMKGVEITYKSILYAHKYITKYTNLNSKATFLNVLPSNHIAGYSSAISCFLSGAELGFVMKMTSQNLSNGFLNYNPTNFIMIPKVYEIIKQKMECAIDQKSSIIKWYVHNTLKISEFVRKAFGIKLAFFTKPIYKAALGKNMKICGCGTSQCSEDVISFYLNLGIDFVNVYGSTETGFPITAANCNERYPCNGVGNTTQFPEIEVVINNPDVNGIGEILVKTPLIMKGYFKDPELTANAFEKDYFKTGDCGFIDKKGYLYITGRIKESIVLPNGKKVSPIDIDKFYSKYCNDIRIASCGIPVGDFDSIHLFIETKGKKANEIEEAKRTILNASETLYSSYKISKIHCIDSIPLTSVGKIKRYMLKEAALNEGNQLNDNSDLVFKQESILNCVFKELSAISHIKCAEISLDKRLKEDLNMDSLDTFEFCVAIDEKYNVTLESHLHEGITVNEIIQVIEQGEYKEPSMINDAAGYPIKRTERDYKSFDRFIRLSKHLWDFNVSGKENIDPDENYIFCPNHESHFDGMWVIGNLDDKIKRSICSIAADYLFEKKIYRQGLIRMGGIPVHRSGNSAPAMKRAYECLSSGNYSLLIHPEGTRTRNGKLGEFKNGAAELAIKSGVKIIPVCIYGAYEIFPPNRKLPRLFDWKHFSKYPLRIQFGTPIEPKSKTPMKSPVKLKNR